MKTNPWRIVAALGLVIVGMGILVLIVKNNNAGNRDFISYWAAGHQLVHGGNPYDGEAVWALERSVGYNSDYHLIMRNPPAALFLSLPLGFVSPNTGLVLWLVALLGSLVVSIRMLKGMLSRRADRLHLLGYCFAPLMICLMAGQFGIFLLLGTVLFLYFHRSRPLLAGAALLLCASKPHLFLPFGIVLLVWVIFKKRYRILAGFCAALLGSCVPLFFLDIHAWSQYAQMMRTGGALDEPVPVLSMIFRALIDPRAVWLQFVPEGAACAWALWYFWTRRNRWSWMNEGMVLLIVSALCRPFGWFSDEAMLLPAVLAGIYQADDSGRSLLPFGIIGGAAILEVLVEIPMNTLFYVWSVPAWLGWYLYATRDNSKRTREAFCCAADTAEQL